MSQTPGAGVGLQPGREVNQWCWSATPLRWRSLLRVACAGWGQGHSAGPGLPNPLLLCASRSYSYMIDNVILLITGTLHQRSIAELVPKCHPLGSFEQMEAVNIAQTPAELYNAILVDTPLGEPLGGRGEEVDTASKCGVCGPLGGGGVILSHKRRLAPCCLPLCFP